LRYFVLDPAEALVFISLERVQLFAASPGRQAVSAQDAGDGFGDSWGDFLLN
jgi:hypothetical protein